MTQNTDDGGGLAPVIPLFPASGARATPPAADAARPEEGAPRPSRRAEASPRVAGSSRAATAWAVPGVDTGEPGHAAAEADVRDVGGSAPERAQQTRAQRRASNVSIAGLSRRNHSRWELERLLLSRDLDDDTVAAEMERLDSLGLIDDEALARTLVQVEHERKGRGRQAIVAELRRRHIPVEIIDAALDELDGDDERQRAFALAESRARQMASLDRDAAVRRLSGYLQRRGYASGIVSEAVRHALSGHRPHGGGGGVRFQ